MGIKRSKFDILFSKVVRTRDEWKCTRCKRDFSDNTGGLHCSHIYGRRHHNTRWMLLNAVSHCFSCHQWFGENPIIAGDWVEDYLGTKAVNTLTRIHHMVKKWRPAEKEEMYQHFKAELSRMIQQRHNGITGILNPQEYQDI